MRTVVQRRLDPGGADREEREREGTLVVACVVELPLAQAAVGTDRQVPGADPADRHGDVRDLPGIDPAGITALAHHPTGGSTGSIDSVNGRSEKS